ncbi:MAG TPA: hypothetical protein VGK78_02030 [Nocardioides sp.]|uniref:hypothetical protein n=1 Tax=Nocardioides sp. TaxID=35761 RepID=UPI002F407F13
MTARLGVAAVAVALLLLPTACGGGDSDADAGDLDAGSFSAAADTGTCVKDATAVTATPPGYPARFPFPAGTVVFNVEDRGADGMIATGVTATPFDDVLAAMNAAEKSGFAVTSGETEEDDAEANWSGNGFVGRWAIKKSASCPGETVIQLLSKRA